MIAVALVLQLAIWLAVAAIFAAQRGASVLHPLAVYLVFHLLVFVLRPALVHFAGFDGQWTYMGFTPTPSGFVETLAVASLALICFAAAALLAAGVGPEVSAAPLEPTRGQRQAFWAAAAVLLPPALLGAHLDLGLFARPLEAGGQLARDAETGYTVFVGTSAYLVKAHNLLGPLAVLVAVVCRLRWWSYLPLLAFLAFRLYLGSRWGVVLAGAMLLALHLHVAGRAWPRLRHVAAVLPLVVLFHLVGQDRDALRDLLQAQPVRHVRAPAPASAGLLDPLDAPDFANFDYLAYIVDRVPARSGPTPTSRSIWPC